MTKSNDITTRNDKQNIKFKYKLLTLFIPVAIGMLSLTGCGGGGSGSNSSNPNPPSPKAGVTIDNSLPETALVDNNALLGLTVHNDDTKSNAYYSQKQMQFALADAAQTLHIQRINLPESSSMQYKIANAHQQNSCCNTIDGSNCNVTVSDGHACELNIDVSSTKPQLLNDKIDIVTDKQTYSIPVKINYLANDAKYQFPQLAINRQIKIVPGSIVSLSVKNTDQHQAINDLQVHLPSWLVKLAKNMQLTRVNNLASGESQIFSFALDANQTTIDALKANLQALSANQITRQISITAANIKAIYPQISASIAPVNLIDQIDFNKPAEQQIKLMNEANQPIKISTIQSSLPNGVTINTKDSTCQKGGQIKVNSQCELAINAGINAIGQGKIVFTFGLNTYTFSKATAINIGKVAIEPHPTMINIPTTGSEQTKMTVINTGAFAWQPSTQASDYLITADPSAKVAPTGLSIVSSTDADNCLSGNLVSPGKSCSIVFNADNTLKNAIYNFTIKATNNLDKDTTTTLTTTGVHAYIDASYNMYQGVKRVVLANDSDKDVNFTTQPLQLFSIYNGKNANTDKGPWCTSITCSNSCISDVKDQNTYELNSGKSCYLYLHSNAKAPMIKVGDSDSEKLSITTKTDKFAFSLQSKPVLYVGGAFTATDQGKLTINNIAMWDGKSWQPLAQGVDDSVNTIKVAADGNVYIGGKFDYFNAGKVPANLIGQWDGQQWQTLDGGLKDANAKDAQVFAMDFTPNGSLFVGGSFNAANNKQLNNIAQWQSNKWIPLASGLNGPVYTISSLGKLDIADHPQDDDDVLIGGKFVLSSGDHVAQNIATWAQGKFIDFGGDVKVTGGSVKAIISSSKDNQLHAIIGGEFTGINNTADTNYIFSLSSAGIQSMTKDAASLGNVYALAGDHHQDVYVGGDFLNLGGEQLNHIAVIQNEAWHQLGSGVDGQVDVIAPEYFNNTTSLYVGGKFKHAGESSTQGIALWDGESDKWQSVGGSLNGDVNALAYGNIMQINPIVSG
ncbi:hypothetical protein [Fangia hongkongensis]|uniref:hypothetical protein n=1 Tax=Fangia hongkongensis TaxID=270495 RepID=UPI00037F77EE|nr:hypothetical protein [Fangia hongkongensis]MBK2124730.1 hypothetical protein [Fangia hongkongensis]